MPRRLVADSWFRERRLTNGVPKLAQLRPELNGIGRLGPSPMSIML